MRLTAICPSCGAAVPIKTRAKDRYQLARKLGAPLKVTCPSCQNHCEFSPNAIKAKEDKRLMAVVLVLSLIAAFFIVRFVLGLMNEYGNLSILIYGVVLIFLPLSVYHGIFNLESSKADYFNWYRYDD